MDILPFKSLHNPQLPLSGPNSHLAQPSSCAFALGQTIAPSQGSRMNPTLTQAEMALNSLWIVRCHHAIPQSGWKGFSPSPGRNFWKKESWDTGITWPESPTHLARPPHPSLVPGAWSLLTNREESSWPHLGGALEITWSHDYSFKHFLKFCILFIH